ncbi:F-box-like protein [Ceratobasidium sp. AG-Ba]|nr:F-box-like protein [Ceratobasidium sp. AG-Ba]
MSLTMLDPSASQAFDTWSTCRTHLADAIKSFVAASAYLNACVRLQGENHMRQAIEPVLAGIDRELRSLALDEERLNNTRLSLITTRNTSIALTPLHLLPEDILSNIFLELNRSEDHDRKNIPPASSVTAVSSHWRNLSLHNPTLWREIYITTAQNSYKCASLLATRARPAPIYLYVFEPHQVAGVQSWHGDRETDALSFLDQTNSRVERIEIVSHTYSTHCIDLVLKSWLQHGSTALGKKLCIKRPVAYLVPDRLPLHWAFSLRSFEHSEDVLQSVTSLHLQEFVVPWSSAAYHNLVDLRLQFSSSSEAKILLAVLASILEKSFRLEILKIAALDVQVSDASTMPPARSLPHLKMLYLGAMSTKSWELLSQLISLSDCKEPLSICFDLEGQAELAGPLGRLLCNAPVQTLVLSQSYTSGVTFRWAVSLSQNISSLETLVLAGFDDAAQTKLWDLVTVQEKTEEITNKRIAKLPQLYLSASDFHLSEIKFIVHSLGVQTLHLEGCNNFITDDPWAPVANETFEARLLEELPGIRCVMSEWETTSDWPCRNIFDKE